MREAASPPKLKRILENMPKEGLVDLFTHFIRLCVRRKVFGDRSVSEIARTIETQTRGGPASSPNQSPMPRERAGDMKAATDAAAVKSE